LADNWVGLKAVSWAVSMVVWRVGKWVARKVIEMADKSAGWLVEMMVELWDERKADPKAHKRVDKRVVRKADSTASQMADQ
jgi:hypothetical protein